MFQRVQLNIGRLGRGVDVKGFAPYLPRGREYILQVGYDGCEESRERVEAEIAYQLDEVRKLRAEGIGISVFFDPSLGTGKRPKVWPSAPCDLPCGYGGGLGSSNLCQELERISCVAGEAIVWIDMETRVRTEDMSRLDFAKIRECLEICQRFSV